MNGRFEVVRSKEFGRQVKAMLEGHEY